MGLFQCLARTSTMYAEEFPIKHGDFPAWDSFVLWSVLTYLWTLGKHANFTHVFCTGGNSINKFHYTVLDFKLKDRKGNSLTNACKKNPFCFSKCFTGPGRDAGAFENQWPWWKWKCPWLFRMEISQDWGKISPAFSGAKFVRFYKEGIHCGYCGLPKTPEFTVWKMIIIILQKGP